MSILSTGVKGSHDLVAINEMHPCPANSSLLSSQGSAMANLQHVAVHTFKTRQTSEQLQGTCHILLAGGMQYLSGLLQEYL